MSLSVKEVCTNWGLGSSLGGGGGDMAQICSITALGVSPVGLPLPLAALTFLPPLEILSRSIIEILQICNFQHYKNKIDEVK